MSTPSSYIAFERVIHMTKRAVGMALHATGNSHTRPSHQVEKHFPSPVSAVRDVSLVSTQSQFFFPQRIFTTRRKKIKVRKGGGSGKNITGAAKKSTNLRLVRGQKWKGKNENL